MGGECRDKTRRRIYNCWLNNYNKCYNPNHASYRNYGARGIEVCKEWLESFENFYHWALKNGYEDNLTIDRIDVNGNYSPENCRWVNMKAQQNNKRTNIYISFNGETLTKRQWEEKLGLEKGALSYRLKLNLPLDVVLTTKEDYGKKKKEAKGKLGRITCEKLYTIKRRNTLHF